MRVSSLSAFHHCSYNLNLSLLLCRKIENAVNYLGMVRCCKAFLPLFKEQAFKKSYEYARIFNLSSSAGTISGTTGLAAYHASKNAAVAFSTCLRIELKAFGIQVTTINPSFHDTPLVNDMYLRADRMWETLPLKLKVEYGQGAVYWSCNLC